jgi:hypothetical protein
LKSGNEFLTAAVEHSGQILISLYWRTERPGVEFFQA